MLARCYSCGATGSLELFIQDQEAAKAVKLALSLSPVGDKIISYLTLFRPIERSLSFKRVTKLLAEIVPMITTQQIKRDGKDYYVPLNVWASALDRVLEMREQRKLSLPFKNHSYLLEVVLSELSKAAEQKAYQIHDQIEREKQPVKLSATMQAVYDLEQMKRGNDDVVR